MSIVDPNFGQESVKGSKATVSVGRHEIMSLRGEYVSRHEITGKAEGKAEGQAEGEGDRRPRQWSGAAVDYTRTPGVDGGEATTTVTARTSLAFQAH